MKEMTMKKKLISLAIAGAVAMPFAAQAGSLTVANQDITLSGGITGGYLYDTDTKKDTYTVTDALLDLSSAAKTGGVGFELGVGSLDENSLAPGSLYTGTNNRPGASNSVTPGFGLQYGWVSVVPMDGLKIDAGKLATNLGSETSPSYANDNILRGLLWNAQPTYYTGARATYTMGNFSVYGEANRGAAISGITSNPVGNTNVMTNPEGNAGGAVGASGNFGPVNAAINYLTVSNVGDMVDLVASGNAGPVKVGANFDYIGKAKAYKVTGYDDSAYGLALYASMNVTDKIVVPVRFEYVDDGTSGIYGLTTVDANNNPVKNSAETITITPTYNFTKATFVRAELAYVTTDKKATYMNDKGNATDSNLVLGAQLGVRF
jgi:hypothetical protein